MELSRVPPAELPPAQGWEPIYELPLPAGTLSISRDDSGTYLFDHPYYGRYQVAANRSSVQCAPAALENWLWQRFLVGQLLPLASLLHGYEPLHASAVGIDGRALLLMGASGAGKSSVALHLGARAGAFHSDDVSALELQDGLVIAHAGPALTSVDVDEPQRLPPEIARAWSPLGSFEGQVRLAGDWSGRRAALPVGGVYVLARRTDTSRIEIASPDVAVSAILLGGTFIAYLRGPQRLVRQLELAARLAQTAPVYQVRMPPGVQASAVAAAIARTHV